MWPANNLIWQAFPPDHQILLFRLYIAMLAVDLKFISCSQNCQHQRNVFFLFFHSRLISFFSLPCRQDGCIWKGNKMWSHVKSFHYLTMIYFTTRTPNSNKMRTKKKTICAVRCWNNVAVQTNTSLWPCVHNFFFTTELLLLFFFIIYYFYKYDKRINNVQCPSTRGSCPPEILMKIYLSYIMYVCVK